jgi:hypothetical protein
VVELAQVVDDDARCRRLVSVSPKPTPRFYDGSEMDENTDDDDLIVTAPGQRVVFRGVIQPDLDELSRIEDADN